jgi:glycine cleavage system H protein
MNPADYRYTKDHEWIKIEGDIATLGITNWAQEQLGDIVSVEFPKIGKVFSKGESVALIDSMKTTSDVFTPVSGEIAQVNEKLEDAPELLNEDPYNEGWIIAIKMSNTEELTDLMTSDEYEVFSEKEGEA